MSNSSVSDFATRSSTSFALCCTFWLSDGYVSPSSSRGWYDWWKPFINVGFCVAWCSSVNSA